MKKTEKLYYIMSPYAPCGNSASWWRIDGHGYTVDLDEAWKVNTEKALSILNDKRGDRAFLVEDINNKAQAHFDVQNIRYVEELEGALQRSAESKRTAKKENKTNE